MDDKNAFCLCTYIHFTMREMNDNMYLILHTCTILQMGEKNDDFFDYLVQYVHEIRRLQKICRRGVCGNECGRRSLVALGAIQA
jgi:hypothetical protein